MSHAHQTPKRGVPVKSLGNFYPLPRFDFFRWTPRGCLLAPVQLMQIYFFCFFLATRARGKLESRLP